MAPTPLSDETDPVLENLYCLEYRTMAKYKFQQPWLLSSVFKDSIKFNLDDYLLKGSLKV